MPQELSYFPAVHVIDLAEDGYIKPHVDSIKVRTSLAWIRTSSMSNLNIS